MKSKLKEFLKNQSQNPKYPSLPFETVKYKGKRMFVGDTDNGQVSLYKTKENLNDEDPIWIDYIGYIKLGKTKNNLK